MLFPSLRGSENIEVHRPGTSKNGKLDAEIARGEWIWIWLGPSTMKHKKAQHQRCKEHKTAGISHICHICFRRLRRVGPERAVQRSGPDVVRTLDNWDIALR